MKKIVVEIIDGGMVDYRDNIVVEKLVVVDI